MNSADHIFGDENDQLLRSILRRVSALETSQRQIPTGARLGFDRPVRGSNWSMNREEAVGNLFTRRWTLNDLNTERVVHDTTQDPSYSIPLGASFEQGRPGGKTNEGSYSVYHVNDDLSYNMINQSVATGQRGWSLELLFSAAVIPPSARAMLMNGSSTGGYGIYLGSTGKILFWLNGLGYLDPNYVVSVNRWYHVIAVADDADNTLKWYIGSFDPISVNFAFTSGSIPMPTPPAVPTQQIVFGQHYGWTDEFSIYNGKIPGGSGLKSAEDRIRATLQPGAPAGFLPTDGGAVSRNRYAALFREIGTTNGSGNGSTTFNLPNVPNAIIKT